MSKTVKRKITVELPKPRDLSKNRLSVFQRLGTKKLKVLDSTKTNIVDTTKPGGPLIANPATFAGISDISSAAAAAHSPVVVVAATVNLLPVAAPTIKIIANKSEHVALEDADPDSLERKRAELKKELELQLKMETVNRKSKKEIVVRKRKKVQRSSSSSSSSSSDSGSSSDSSSSSTSKDTRRKVRKTKGGGKRHHNNSSSSSADDAPRLKKPIKVKKVCHKRLDANKLKVAHAKKVLAAAQGGAAKLRKRSLSPGGSGGGGVVPIRKRTIAALPLSAKVGGGSGSGSHKIVVKKMLVGVESAAAKSHRLKEAAREKEREFQHREREREKEQRDRMRMRDKDRPRSRSPLLKMRPKSRSPPMKRSSRSRDMKHIINKSSPPPLQRRPPSKTRSGAGSIRRERSLDRGLGGGSGGGIKKELKRHDSRERERERRDRERDREAIREKERQEILARCQERQRERERIAREKTRKIEREREEERAKSDRLLPRPAERAMALAAARGRSREKSDERDHRPRSHSHHSHGHGHGHSIRDRLDHRSGDKEALLPAYDRGSGYLDREELRYDPHRRIEKVDDRALMRDDRDRGDYVVVRRREDSRDNNRMNSPLPYHGQREKRMPDRDDHIDRSDAYDHGGIVDHQQRYDDHSMLREDRRGGAVSGSGVGGSGSSGAHDYGSSRGYIDERPHRSDRDREWMRSDSDVVRDDRNVIFDRHPVREWDRGEMGSVGNNSSHQSNNPVRDNYGDNRDWSNSGMNERQWDSGVSSGGGGGGGGGNVGNSVSITWQPEPEENWDNPDDKEWQDYHRNPQDKGHHDGGCGNDINSGNSGTTGGGGNQMTARGGNRRWTNWRGRRGGNQHHQSDFRRQVPQQQQQQQQHSGGGGGSHLHQDSFTDRSDQSYRRHQPNHSQQEQTLHCNSSHTDFGHNVTATRPHTITTPKLDVMASPIKIPLILLNDPIAPGTSDAQIDIATTAVPVVVVPSSPLLLPEASTGATLAQPIPVLTVIKEAMTGHTATEDGDEVIADDLSEISDDADEILNRQEELQEKANDARNAAAASAEAAALVSGGDGAADDPSAVDSLMPTTDSTTLTAASPPELNESNPLPDEMDLAFEEISDGELEEEARIRGLGDALGVDWASLVEESKAIAKEKSLLVVKDTSAKQRWQPHRILLDVGVSFRMAGKEFASNVLNQAHRKLKEEQSAADARNENVFRGVTVKAEQTDVHNKVEGFDIKEIKEEPAEEELLLIHPIACVQVASRVNAEHRKNLVFHATGPYSRALSARRDIQMRRQLCGLPIKDYHCGALVAGGGNSRRLDSGYASIARQLFEKALAKAN